MNRSTVQDSCTRSPPKVRCEARRTRQAQEKIQIETVWLLCGIKKDTTHVERPIMCRHAQSITLHEITYWRNLLCLRLQTESGPLIFA